MAGGKRKRDILDFDHNKSDSEDENFEPGSDRPSRVKKKSRPTTSRRGRGRRRRDGYGGSDIDEEEVFDSDEHSFADDDMEDDEEDEVHINEATGRPARRATRQTKNYAESDDEDNDEAQDSDRDELGETTKKKEQKQTKIVVLRTGAGAKKSKPNATAAATPSTQRSTRNTRARTADAEGGDFVELSNSGKHALTARGSKSISPEAATRATRATRSGKAPVKAPIPPIEEATQESSPRREGDVEDAIDEDDDEPKQEEADSAEANEAAVDQVENRDQPMETVEPDQDDDEDDAPITRRLRNRPSLSGPADEESDSNKATNKRLTRRNNRKSKSQAEPSSDFEPGNDSGDDNESQSDKGKGAGGDDDEDSSPAPRGRTRKGKGRPRRSHQAEDSASEVDEDEVAAEAEELEHDSRSRTRRQRQRRRTSPPIEYQNERQGRTRKPVNYAIPPLNQLAMEPEEEDPAPTPARRRGGRAGAAAGWDRSLHTTAGPFGGVGSTGSGALFGGPWGTGAAGGVDSDSSDDEMVHRSGVGGNVGMTPTTAAPPGMLGGGGGVGHPHGLEGLANLGTAAPNVGKVKNQKAYADADPLGVDMNVDFSKVGGLEGHIDQLKEMVQLPLLYPELFMKFHVTPPRGVLFHGPPGTGKTLLARALANSVGIGGKKITFYMRKGADALSKWVGEAEKQLRMLFEEARRTQPSIIFFDEIDGLAPVRSSKQEQIHASIVSTLLALMDGMDGRGQVIVIGATNRPDNIDPALRRPGRFDREFYFPLPDIDSRRAIIDIHTKDWGLSDDFKNSLARDAKGYGGADLRALCTEAAMNAIQRTYPQIYSSKEKLLVKPENISIHMTDFSLSKKKIIPSSERASTSGAAPLPKAIEPLLRSQFKKIIGVLDNVLPRKKKATALEEAMFEPYDDDDFGFGREALNEEFERARVFRPRLLICGRPGMGHSYLSAAILHHLEGVHVQNFDLPSILGDPRSAEQTLVSLFTEVRRHKPSVIFIPNVDTWYSQLEGPALTTFLGMLRSIQPTEPIMVLGTAESEPDKIPTDLKRDLFGFSRKNNTEIDRPVRDNRREYFSAIISHIRRTPKDFPDPAHRKKRVLEQLPLAPPPPPKVLTKAEENAEWLRYRHLMNLMKVYLQPIMDQINRKYKKFRMPVIPQSQYQYLFDEQDPNYVRPDVEDSLPRPYETDHDKDGVSGLRSTDTGKFFYNLDIQTIEERLANGFYVQPHDFLKDVKALRDDAKASGDRDRFIKADELYTNVEVDVNDVDQKFRLMGVDWDQLYDNEKRRRDAKAERARKKAALQPIVDLVTSDVGNGDQHPPKLPTTNSLFQPIGSPLPNGDGENSTSYYAPTNGASVTSGAAGEDSQMTDADAQQQGHNPQMQPPAQWPPTEPRALDTSTRATKGCTTQISQVSAVQSLPPGVSPSALVNYASTTTTNKTDDPSNRSSNWSTQVTNGIHQEQSSPGEPIPDTQPYGDASQKTSSDEQWIHSQAHGLARGTFRGFSQETRSDISPSATRSSHAPASMANLLNDPSPDEQSQIQRPSGGSIGSQHVALDDNSAGFFLEQLATRTSGCTIEQLEQVTREMMMEIWRTKGEHNRMKVLDEVTQVFNDTISDITEMQQVLQLSQLSQ